MDFSEHSSGGWEVHHQGVGRFGVCREPSDCFQGGALLPRLHMAEGRKAKGAALCPHTAEEMEGPKKTYASAFQPGFQGQDCLLVVQRTENRAKKLFFSLQI